MNFELVVLPKLTRELLLENNTQETYFEHYLGVPIKKGLFRSPAMIRKDINPTCAFYKDKKGRLIYKDFAGPTFDFIGCVMYLYGCNYYNALKIIANDFNIINYTNLEKHQPKIQYTNTVLEKTTRAKIFVTIKDFTTEELDWWKSFGISLSTLKKFKVFSIDEVYLNGVFIIKSTTKNPIFGYYGGQTKEKDYLWRLYMPNKIKNRFISNWPASMIQGIKQLPKNGNYIIITKSLKDVMSLFEFGIPAIAPNTENIFLTEKQYEKLKLRFNDIYLLYDRDLPGVTAAQKIRKQFSDIKVLLMPGSKDFSDYVKKYGILKTFNLIELWQKRTNQ